MQRRLNILLILAGLLFCVLLGRLAQLQLIQGEQYGKKAQFNMIRTTLVPAPRGKILDRNGLTLAYDLPRLNVCAVISEIPNRSAFANKLAPLIDSTPETILKILKKHEKNPYEKILIKAKLDKQTIMRVAEMQWELPGVHLEVQPVREYPQGDLAAHVLGYVGEITEEELKSPQYKGRRQGDIVGKDGIEKYYDQYLQGRCGEIEELALVTGKVFSAKYRKNVGDEEFCEREKIPAAAAKIISQLKEIPPMPGYNLFLTIDIELQRACEQILKKYVDSLSKICKEPLAGCVVIMNCRNGEILAMASYPSFDPNLFSKGLTEKQYDELIKRKDYPLMNRTIAGAYPPASTFKIITAAAALQEKVCTRYSPFYCSGRYKVGNMYFYCFVKTGHGKIDFRKALSESCDVVFYFLGECLDIDKLLQYARQFGLGEKTDIDLPGESPGLLPDNFWKTSVLKEPWYTGDTVNLAIGQGYLATTPLQMAIVTGIVANKGFSFKPHILKRVERADGKVLKTVNPIIGKKAKVKKEHFDAIIDGMREAVLTGTAKKLKIKYTKVAAKTGTAENFPCPENPHGRNHTWIVGLAPLDDPQFVIVVFLEKSGGLAGDTVVPLASEILEAFEPTYIKIMAQQHSEVEKRQSDTRSPKSESGSRRRDL